MRQVSRQPCIKAAAEEIAQCCSQTEETFAKLELVQIKNPAASFQVCLSAVGLCAGVKGLLSAHGIFQNMRDAFLLSVTPPSTPRLLHNLLFIHGQQKSWDLWHNSGL